MTKSKLGRKGLIQFMLLSQKQLDRNSAGQSLETGADAEAMESRRGGWTLKSWRYRRRREDKLFESFSSYTMGDQMTKLKSSDSVADTFICRAIPPVLNYYYK